MNILLVNRALGTLFGGGESFDFNAARYIQQRGHQVTVVTGKPLWGEAKNTFQDLDLFYLATPQLRHFAYATEKFPGKLSAAVYHLDNILFEKAVYRWLTKQPQGRFDVVQCCSLFRLPGWLVQRFGQPVVSWLPGPPSGLVRRRLPELCRHPRFALFTHGSPAWSLDKLGLTSGRDYTLIEPGVELAYIDATPADRLAMRAALGIGANELLGVTTARLVPVKNHAQLLTAIALAKAQGLIWHWLIIGNGPLAQNLKDQANALGVTTQVHFLGYQPQEAVHRWLAAADLFALTSEYESFSIATLEAMAHRLPVIGTQVGYLQQLIRDAQAGLVVPKGSPEALAAALGELSAQSLRTQFGSYGRVFVERLDWPRVAEKLENLYQRVVAGAPR